MTYSDCAIYSLCAWSIIHANSFPNVKAIKEVLKKLILPNDLEKSINKALMIKIYSTTRIILKKKKEYLNTID